MRVPVTKTLSSLYLDTPRDAPDSGIPELLPSLGSSPCGTAATSTAVWAGADHGRSSMPLLPPPAARLSLCIDFPGYLQAQQHSLQSPLTLPPLSLRRKAPAMLLSALYSGAAEPSGDPRANLPAQDSALPPGFSLGSLAGGAIADGGDNGRRKRGSSSSTVGGEWHGGRESARASVDAAATAEILSSWEHGQCPPLTYGPYLPQPQVAAVAMDGPGDAIDEKLKVDNIAGRFLQTLQLAAAMTAEPLSEPWVSPPSRPPPDSPEVAISQSQVPVQMEWSFDGDIQRARTQARHAAMVALGEIRYEHNDDSHCSSKDGGAGGHGSHAWGCFGGGGARLYSSDNGKSNGGAAAGSNDNVAAGSSSSRRRRPGGKGVALLLLSAFRCKTLRAVAVDGRKQRKYDSAACGSGIRTVLHCKASSGCRLGASNRGRSECARDSHTGVDENDEEEKGDGEDGEEALLVLRSRDSRLVHRVRLAMDVSRGPAAVRRSVLYRSSPKAQDAAAAPTSVATDDLDAVMAAAAATFTTATSEERPALSGPQPPLTAETVPCRAAGQRRVWFRCPLVDRIHWFTRCRDTNSGSYNYGEDSDGKNLSKVRLEWLDLKRPGSRCSDTVASGSSYSNFMGRPTHARSESLTALLRRRSLSLLSLAGKLMASGRSLEAEPAETVVDLSRRSVNPCVLAARGVW